MKVFIINGPNLNLLGKREKSIYGDISFQDYFDKLQEVGFSYDYILLNAGGYTHTSVALADAISAIETPVIEVHISNIYAREEFRQKSLLSPNCKAVICGLGLDSYKAALLTLK